MTSQLDTTSRRMTAALAIVLLGAASLLGCSSSGDGDAADDDRASTTTTEAATTTEASTTTSEADVEEEVAEPSDGDIEEGVIDGLLEQMTSTLEASSLDPEVLDCVLEVFEGAARGDIAQDEVEQGYVGCGASIGQIGIATFEGALRNEGIDEEAVACVVATLSERSDEEIAAAMEGDGDIQDVVVGCGVPEDALG